MIGSLKGLPVETIVALIGAGLTSILAFLKERKAKRAKASEVKELTKKLEKKDQVNDFLKENLFVTKMNTLKRILDIRSMNKVEKIHCEIFDNTEMDRFTIMFLMNGKLDFNYMSVIYDMSDKGRSLEGFLPYERVRIDENYRDFITNLPRGRGVWKHGPFTKEMGPMFEWMTLEGIKHGVWYKVARIALDDYNDLLVYLDWTSEEDKSPSWQTMRKVDLVTTTQVIPALMEILTFPQGSEVEDLIRDINGNTEPLQDI